jgi:hypothetical protein
MQTIGARSRAELWAVALRDVLPARLGVACFHGSLSVEERARVAERCRDVAARWTPERSYARALELLEEAARLAAAPR